MLDYAKKKIKQSKLYSKPFPFFVVYDLIPKKKLDKINKILPSFKEITEKDIYFQSSSQTKKHCYLAQIGTRHLVKIKILKKLTIFLKV